MSWFSGSNPMDELVERATDSSLPADSEDLALNLEICDQIRSKTINSKDAMRSLKKRISNKNPNVQLLALNLTDLCIKNGGSHFLVEIASREFVDNLVSLLKAPLGINHDVRERLLILIQAWALAFEPRSELGYMMTTYQALRNDGMQFPPEERVAAAFVDSAAPPDWADSDVCMRCRTAFTFRNRKHHCRNCGNVFCGACSTQTMTLPHLGINEPVRVCDGCHAKRAQSTNPNRLSAGVRHKTVPSYQHTPTHAAKSQSRDAEDLDLKRALEMSLAESERASTVQAQPSKPSSTKQASAQEDEDDADLKAAIAASLRETSHSKQVESPYAYPSLNGITSSVAPYSNVTEEPKANIAAPPPQQNSLELSSPEQENIKLFATLVERRKTDQGGSILRDSQIQELYDTISNLRPKLARSLRDTVGKYESLVETHSKLATAIKYYDSMLEARLATTYGGENGHQGGYQPHFNPSVPPNYYGVTPATQQQQAPDATQSYNFGQPLKSTHVPDYARTEYIARYDTANPHRESLSHVVPDQRPSGFESATSSAQAQPEVSLIDL